jgi:ribosomal protein S12 methylthiotransferase
MLPFKKINLISLGCSKNTVDAEYIFGTLEKFPIELHFDASSEGMDLVIINTCGFIQDAKEESIELILQHAIAKKQGRIGKLMVMGCLSQRYASELKNEIPEIDYIFGVHDYDAIIQLLTQKLAAKKNRFISTPSHYAYLKIAEGCNRKCSFCAIPSIRGKLISQPISVLLKEAEQLAEKGVKELNIIAQDICTYGKDLKSNNNLFNLVRELDQLALFPWIRLLYAYPIGFPVELLHYMAESKSICNYIDMPFQHINDGMLKAMKRGHNTSQTKNIIKQIREILPDASLRTTLLVGFPGETDAAFEELLEFVEESRFDRMGAFSYSHEEGTSAFNLHDNIAEDVKRERMERLMQLQQQISWEKNQEKIGKKMQVIIDRKEEDYWIGRSEFDAAEVDNEIILSADKELQIGAFYMAEITDAVEFDLFAKADV